MSAQTKRHLEMIALILALFGALSAWAVLPYRIDQLEKGGNEIRANVKALDEKRQSDHALLERIDERTGEIQKTLVEMRAASKQGRE